MTGDNFYNGYKAPPQTVPLTGIPIVGTGANDIPSILTTTASFAMFDSGAISSAISPATPTLSLQITTVDPTSSATPADVKFVQVMVLAGAPIMDQVTFNCTAKYSRTWWNKGPAGPGDPPHRFQVWRFVFQGESDWSQHPGTPGPERPDCYPVFQAQFQPIYKGFIDYILESSDGSLTAQSTDWHLRLSLSHHAGCISHINFPNVNGAAIAGLTNKHLNRSYHVVAPAAGWNWLGNGSSTSIADRFTIGVDPLDDGFTGELRSHDDILDSLLPGSAAFGCLTEQAYFWEPTNGTISDDCGGYAVPNGIYFCQLFSFQIPPWPPAQPIAYSWCYDTVPPGPPVWYENMFYLVANPLAPPPGYGIFAWPFFRLELGHWNQPTGPNPAPEWAAGLDLYACGGAFYHQDAYNRGNSGPYPDPLGGAAHDPLQLVWGVTTDHEDQPPHDRPILEAESVMVEPIMLTDFANQLRAAEFYPMGMVPDPPEVHFGDPWVTSSLVWQIAEMEPQQ